MKLSDRTLSILKNFSTINQSIVIPEGNTLAVVAPGNNILGRAIVDDYFPTQLAIYDLNKFLGAVSLLNEPEFSFDEDHVIKMHNGPTTIRYACADDYLINHPPQEAPKLPEPVFSSNEMSSHVLTQLMKAASVMKLEDITLKGRGGKMQLIAHNTDNPSADQYCIDLDDVAFDCDITLNINNLKVHTGADYQLNVHELQNGVVLISAHAQQEGELMYVISSESGSKIR